MAIQTEEEGGVAEEVNNRNEENQKRCSTEI